MTEQIASGFELMFAGMGIVFLFLIMLVFVINLMSTLIQRFFPEAPPATPRVIPGITTDSDKRVIAAISAAVHQYRKKHL